MDALRPIFLGRLDKEGATVPSLDMTQAKSGRL